MAGEANYALRDEIRDYWSKRAETFDLSVGHEIFSERERRAWHRLILKHLGAGSGRRALDLACGTGVVSHLMHDLGYAVTGLDWSQAMLSKARAKATQRESSIRFLLGDAERTLEEKECYDVLVTRHLVWTLVDPRTAFAEWFSLLKPGGRLLIVDGDFVTETWAARLRRILERLRCSTVEPAGELEQAMVHRHRSILSRLHFSRGARADEVCALLMEAGFEVPVVDMRLGAIHRAQAQHLNFLKALERTTQHRYAICATKPQVKFGSPADGALRSHRPAEGDERHARTPFGRPSRRSIDLPCRSCLFPAASKLAETRACAFDPQQVSRIFA